ncbi:UNVERIFIED_CONTAM: SARP family transcriptional regulator [Williamsia faeni]
MRYQILGPLEVLRNDGSESRIDLGSPKQRIILAILLIHRGKVVSTDRLCDALWGDEAPPSATSSLQAYISNLRRALRNDAGTSPIRRQSTGYILDVADCDVDVSEFLAHAGEAQQHADNEEWAPALDSADRALALWRGPLLDGQGDEDWVRTEAAGLEEIRSGSMENRITALLALNRLPEALADVVALRNRQPYRDHSCWLHMLALHRAGRSAEALDVFGDHAHRLDTDLGLEPSTELRDLQGAVLRHDPELIAWPRKPIWSGAGELRVPDNPPAQVSTDAEIPTHRGLIGRVRELDHIAAVLQDVLAGDTRWLIFIGPPGIGKTRLADEVAHLMHSAGGRAVWARNPEEGAPSWWPARQLVESLGSDPGEVFLTTGAVDADTARFTVYDRVQRIIEQSSETRPLAVIVDDAQWADSMSVGALASLATAVHRHPIAFVITLREGEHNPAIARLLSAVARGTGNRQIVVPVLDEAEVGALANEIATEELTADEVAGLAKRTGGNPLFVSEYARLPAGERSTGELPVAVRSVLGLRLAGLDPAVLQVLRMAAVIGDTIDIVLLSRATGLDIDTLADQLDAAADERIVTATPGSDSYAFAHGLLREEVLVQIPALRRKRAHAKVAEILADAEGSDALGRRAQHLMAALPLVDPELAVDACMAAAEASAAQWHSEVAAHWWQQAMIAYALLPMAEQVDERRDELTVLLLESLSRAGKGQTVMQTVEAALTTAVQAEKSSTIGKLAGSLLRSGGGWPWVSPAEDPASLLALLARTEETVADDPGERAQVLGALSVGHSYDPDPTIAPELIRRAEGFAEFSHDPDIIAEVMMARLITFSGVATHARESVALINSLLALNHRQARFDAVIAHSIGTMATFTLGDVSAARSHLQLAIAGSEELNLPILRAQLRWMEVVVAVWIGDFERAQQHQAIAKRVHEQTELYVTGQADMSLMSLSRELGSIAEIGADRALETITGVAASTEDTNMLGVIAAGTAGIPGAPVDRALAAALVAQRQATCGAHVWHTLGHAVALAHVVADFELTAYAEEFITELEPFSDHIGLIGQLGNVGPVALALSRLYLLTGNLTAARESVAVAAGIAERTGGLPTLLRCRVLGVRLRPAGDLLATELDDLERQAEKLGMAGVLSEVRGLRTAR